MGPSVTGYLILAWLAVAGIYALLARLIWGVDATVSVVVGAFGREHPIVVFLAGLAVGLLAHHWWGTA